jgi:hypothetical protein
MFSSAAVMNSKAKHSTGRRDGNGAGVEPNGGVRYKIPSNRRLIGRASERRSKMIAFGYYGGKFSHLDFILPLLPTHFTHYCEVFGGRLRSS